MFTAPVLVFFGAKHIAENQLEAEPPWSLLGPAILLCLAGIGLSERAPACG